MQTLTAQNRHAFAGDALEVLCDQLADPRLVSERRHLDTARCIHLLGVKVQPLHMRCGLSMKTADKRDE